MGTAHTPEQSTIGVILRTLYDIYIYICIFILLSIYFFIYLFMFHLYLQCTYSPTVTDWDNTQGLGVQDLWVQGVGIRVKDAAFRAEGFEP